MDAALERLEELLLWRRLLAMEHRACGNRESERNGSHGDKLESHVSMIHAGR